MRILLTLLALLLPPAAMAQDAAQDAAPSPRMSHCIAIADAAPGIGFLHRASFRDPPAAYSVRITYLDHAMFLLQTPGGLSAVTDYTGHVGAVGFAPTVATMNNAHDTHWTGYPDPGIAHVLEGWATGGAPRDHHLDLGEMLVRNVHTDVRSSFSGVRPDGNSIFVFEVEGLCVGHLGHLHHMPDEMQMAALGRLDVVMAAVDGGLTLDLPTMIDLLKRLKSSVVIPMHWFSTGSLERFLVGMQDAFDIRRDMPNAIELSLRTLPPRPTVVVLAPRLLSE